MMMTEMLMGDTLLMWSSKVLVLARSTPLPTVSHVIIICNHNGIATIFNIPLFVHNSINTIKPITVASVATHRDITYIKNILILEKALIANNLTIAKFWDHFRILAQSKIVTPMATTNKK